MVNVGVRGSSCIRKCKEISNVKGGKTRGSEQSYEGNGKGSPNSAPSRGRNNGIQKNRPDPFIQGEKTGAPGIVDIGEKKKKGQEEPVVSECRQKPGADLERGGEGGLDFSSSSGGKKKQTRGSSPHKMEGKNSYRGE